MDNYVLRITGMTCAACSARVEKAINKIDGVKNCAVNLTTERMTVQFAPSITDLNIIKNRVEKIGYGWEEIKKDMIDDDKIRKEKEIKTLWQKFIVAAVFGFPTLLL